MFCVTSSFGCEVSCGTVSMTCSRSAILANTVVSTTGSRNSGTPRALTDTSLRTATTVGTLRIRVLNLIDAWFDPKRDESEPTCTSTWGGLEEQHSVPATATPFTRIEAGSKSGH